MSEIVGHISFAFITPIELLPCEKLKQHDLISEKVDSLSSCLSSESSSLIEATPVTKKFGTKVYVRFFDTLRKATRTQCFSIQSKSTMSYMYEMIHAWLPEVGNLVCYTVHNDSNGRLFPLVKEALHSNSEVPKLLFCQEVFLPLQKFTERWGVINILVLQHNGDIIPGYIPLMIHQSSMCSKEMIQEQVRHLSCTSPAEVNYMKVHPILYCIVYDRFVDLISFFDTSNNISEVLPQIALVYPGLVAGDLVRIDMVDRINRRFSVQGIIKRSQRKDGVLCYDVEDPSIGHIFEGLTCVQVLPL